jgi:hypothetical protein
VGLQQAEHYRKLCDEIDFDATSFPVCALLEILLSIQRVSTLSVMRWPFLPVWFLLRMVHGVPSDRGVLVLIFLWKNCAIDLEGSFSTARLPSLFLKVTVKNLRY